ncbi:MAG TPA: ATP-binding protein [Streptosporangiaceae bacterium]|nr:ATP-binding protein [Streptosporangiaceae bacterium]
MAGQRIGRLGLQLTLAFVGVAVMAVMAASAYSAVTVTAAEHQALSRQEVDETSAVAIGAAATYVRNGWSRALVPVIMVADRTGAVIRVRDAKGAIVGSSPAFASFPPGPEHREPVIVGGRHVGSITMKFDDRGTGAVLAHFNAQRWSAGIIGGSFGVLLALLAALVVAPRITAPVDRVLHAARAMGSGQPDSRAGTVRGYRDMRDLTAAFDQMADALSRQEQVRRNLVADIAHELRTPIAVLQAGTEAMLDGVTELTAGQVDSLHDEILRLSRMVDDLQRLASAEAAAVQLTLAPADLTASATAVADSLTELFDRAGIVLVRRLTEVHARCDQLRMHDVITNLLTNAAKFTPVGGTVVIETRPSGKMALLQVSDTGIGIPPDELAHVSERFFRGQNSAEVAGSGIGLAIVDELVRGHHGTMLITSEPGTGTQVTITLPRAAE